MGLKVICAGLPRTGTESLQSAFGILGMTTFPKEAEVWKRAISGETVDWKTAFGTADVVMGLFAALFWDEIWEAHPDAFIVLSVRPDDEWHESLNATILPHIRKGEKWEWWRQAFQRLTGKVAWDSPSALKGGYYGHNQDVARHGTGDGLRPENVLIWEAKEGWEPLCEALGVPVPDVPFPHRNTREEWE